MWRIQLATLSMVSRATDGALHGVRLPARETAYLTKNTTCTTNTFTLYCLTGVGETEVIITVA